MALSSTGTSGKCCVHLCTYRLTKNVRYPNDKVIDSSITQLERNQQENKTYRKSLKSKIHKLSLLENMSTYLIGASKQRLTSMHLNQYAPKTPHVDGKVVRQTKKNLRWSVETALDVLVNLLALTVSTHYCAANYTVKWLLNTLPF